MIMPKIPTIPWKKALIRIALYLFFLECSLRLGGMLFAGFQDLQNLRRVHSGDELRILCIGASETALGGEDAYPSQLEKILRSKYPNANIVVLNKGIPAVTTEYVADHIEEFIKQYRPRIITTLLGAVDARPETISKNNVAKAGDWLNQNIKIVKLLADIVNPPGPQNTAGSVRPVAKKIPEKFARQITRAENILSENPSARGYRDLGKLYLLTMQAEPAFKNFKQAVALDPSDFEAWFYIGRHYKEQVDYPQAIAAFKNALQRTPDSRLELKLLLYSHTADCYQTLQEYQKAEEYWRIMLSLSPQTADYYGHLGRCYLLQEQYSRAIPLFQKNLELNPLNVEVWGRLSYCYRKLGNLPAAQRILELAIKSNPGEQVLFAQLGDYFLEEKNYINAKPLLEKALTLKTKGSQEDGIDIGTDMEILRNLSQTYAALGENEKSDRLKTILKKREGVFNPVTRRDYQRIFTSLQKHNIKLVAIQYPMRSINNLKDMFDGDQEVIYVDNQKSFQQAVAKGTYYEYFHDRIFGDFGHSTAKGNRIIAQNIADAVAPFIPHK